MKKFVCFTFVCFTFVLVFLLNFQSKACAYNGECFAKAAVLFQPDTNTVLYNKDARQNYLVASTTKIMTALVVLENANLDEIVEITSEYTDIEGSSMYLKAGERFSVKELLYGLMLSSGNDAAVALACHISGTIDEFSVLMNKKAAALGCVNTHFSNPHGLDDDTHYSCAIDLAIIMKAVMENADFAEIVSTKSIEIAGRTFTNHNKLLWNCDGCIGGKTGYTKKAGRILVSVCKRNGMELICVTISDDNDWNDHKALYDWAYAEFELIDLSDNFDIPVISGTKETVLAGCDKEYLLVNKKDETAKSYTMPDFVYAPVHKGEQIGSVVISSNGANFEYTVTAKEDVPLDEKVPLKFWEQLKWSWYYYNGHTGYLQFLPRY